MKKNQYLFFKVCFATIIIFLLLPFTAETAGASIHRVAPGESLFSVAQKYKIPLQKLLNTNAYINYPELIYPNQVLIIPKVPELNDESPPIPPAADGTQSQPTISQLSRIYSSHFYLRGLANPNYIKVSKVALTFDDGPDGVHTPLVLDILKEYNVPATFFLIGENVQRYPEVVRDIISAGHIIGNHSWSHPDLSKTVASSLTEEIKRTEDILEVTTGLRTMLMRPPYGAVNQDTLERLIELDYYIINWSVDSLDWWEQAVDPVLINTLPNVREGAIMLFHSIGGTEENPFVTTETLPILIETLRMQGYTFVTLDELLHIPPYR